jgi:STE24 endopeptidase
MPSDFLPTDSLTAIRYQHALDVLWLLDQAYLIALPLLFVFSGFAKKLYERTSKLQGGRVVAIGTSVLVLSLIYFIARLPLGYAEALAVPAMYGLSHPDVAAWAAELTGDLIIVPLAIVLACIFHILVRRLPRTWWFAASLVSVPILAFVLVIGPAFENGTPLENPTLQGISNTIAARVGLSSLPITVLKEGPPVGYVTGFAGTQRVVFSQAALNILGPEEFRFVLSHEVRHFLMGDLWKLVGTVFLTVLIGSLVGHLLASYCFRTWPSLLGTDFASPVVLLVATAGFVTAFTFLVPAITTINRSIEREADIFALELTHANEAAATSFLKRHSVSPLAVVEPGWFQLYFRESHDSTKARIELTRNYHPWETGLPLRYGNVIRAPRND